MSLAVLLVVEGGDPKSLTEDGIFGSRPPVVERRRHIPDLPLTEEEARGRWSSWREARVDWGKYGWSDLYTESQGYERALVIGYAGRVIHSSMRRVLQHVQGTAVDYILASMIDLYLNPDKDDPDGLRDNNLLKLPGRICVVEVDDEGHPITGESRPVI